MIPAIVSWICYIGAICCILYLIRLLFKNKSGNLKDKIQHIGIIATSLIALGTAFLSIELSNSNLRSAKELATIQSRPYLFIKDIKVTVKDEMRNEVDKLCEFKIDIQNGGTIPAVKISSIVNISFKNSQGGIVQLSTHPKNTSVLKIERDQDRGLFTLSRDSSRAEIVKTWINRDDSDQIVQGLRRVDVNILLFYSAPGYSNKWSYEIKSKLTRNIFEIIEEKID